MTQILLPASGVVKGFFHAEKGRVLKKSFKTLDKQLFYNENT